MRRRNFMFNILLSSLGVQFSTHGKNKHTGKKKMKMPVIFIGHGSPMNAIYQNDFTKTLSLLERKIPTPKAILMISAHWMTRGTFVTAMDNPKTIYDFGGFPNELYKVEYKARGDRDLANKLTQKITRIKGDQSWGLDHGTWSVLKHIYPKANIPILQLSIDQTRDLKDYYELGKDLQFLREEGILIMGSGNLVHNLRDLEWDDHSKNIFPWAKEFDEWIKIQLSQRNHEALYRDVHKHPLFSRSHPSIEHYVPLIYLLGATHTDDRLDFIFEGFQNASISMRSAMWFSQSSGV